MDLMAVLVPFSTFQSAWAQLSSGGSAQPGLFRVDCCPCFSSETPSSLSDLTTFLAFERKSNPGFVLELGRRGTASALVLSLFRNPAVSVFPVLYLFALFGTLLSILLDEEGGMAVADGEFPSPVVNKMDLDLFPDAFR